jgi:DNA-binding CsgD family transcriptional regulator
MQNFDLESAEEKLVVLSERERLLVAAAAEAAAHLVGTGFLKTSIADARLSDIDYRLRLMEAGDVARPGTSGKVGGVTPPVSKLSGSFLDALTPREREVLELIYAGYSNKEAGKRLQISPRTIEVHRTRFMEKLGARNAAHLIKLLSSAQTPRSGRST